MRNYSRTRSFNTANTKASEFHSSQPISPKEILMLYSLVPCLPCARYSSRFAPDVGDTHMCFIPIARFKCINSASIFLLGRQETAAWRQVSLHVSVSISASPSSPEGFAKVWIHSSSKGWRRCCRLVKAPADKVHHGHLDLIETIAGNLLHAIWRRIVTLDWSLNRLNSDGMRYSPCINLCFGSRADGSNSIHVYYHNFLNSEYGILY
jgi:hypothetical protein